VNGTEAEKLEGTVKPKDPKYRRRYKVDRLSGAAQEAIFQGFLRGDSYKKICAAVKAMGEDIGENALSRYWRRVWHKQVDRVRMARATKETLKEALMLKPGTENAKIAEELLYTVVFDKLEDIEKQDPMALFREAREQRKSSGKEESNRAPAEAQTPVEQGRAIRRRWRELYGMEESDDGEEDKPKGE
jgi:hypothetical protein